MGCHWLTAWMASTWTICLVRQWLCTRCGRGLSEEIVDRLEDDSYAPGVGGGLNGDIMDRLENDGNYEGGGMPAKSNVKGKSKGKGCSKSKGKGVN